MNEFGAGRLPEDEYILLQSQYENYDNRSITIKGWVASGATVAIALGFSTTHKFSYLIPVAVGIIVVSIWYLETYWKLFQYALRPRIQVIEAHFRRTHSACTPTRRHSRYTSGGSVATEGIFRWSVRKRGRMTGSVRKRALMRGRRSASARWRSDSKRSL